eukprot:7322682-Pyramimonas_sp.AAC.1
MPGDGTSISGLSHSPPTATCFTDERHSQIDYFIACARLGAAEAPDTFGEIFRRTTLAASVF